MGNLIMWNLITIDGFFEGKKKWELDWHEYAWGEELEQLSVEQLKSANMLIFGSVTYTGMANYWSTAEGEIANLMNNIPKVVISDSPITADWNNTKIISNNVVEEIKKLKEQSIKVKWYRYSGHLEKCVIGMKLLEVTNDNEEKELFESI